MNATEILARHGLAKVEPRMTRDVVSVQILGTLCSNLAYYGYVPSADLLEALRHGNVNQFWLDIEPVLSNIKGADRKMEDFVVYKNFPQEVLDMSEGAYWLNQILMYLGAPNEWFTTEPKPRAKMLEKVKLTVLDLAKEDSLNKIFNNLLSNPSRWTREQKEMVLYLMGELPFSPSIIPFKENLVTVMAEAVDKNLKLKISPTDVLRLAAALSDGDATLKTNTKFKLKKKTRRYLLSLLNVHSKDSLQENFARHRGKWKRLLFGLHPNKHEHENVYYAYGRLCKNNIETFNSGVEFFLEKKSDAVFFYLRNRPGEFMRRFHKCASVFGTAKTVDEFKIVLPKLSTIQLLKIKRYVENINDRNFLVYPPKGNWNKLKVVQNNKSRLVNARIKELSKEIDNVIKERLNNMGVKSVSLDPKVEQVKIQTNDSDLSPYGRGTVFDVPENIKFLRSTSYWKTGSTSWNIWYDNGWNFFNKNWKPVDACCWTNVKTNGAVFSGDPTNKKDLKGRACQMIDLYLDELEKNNIRYAVWNILCYSRKSFNQAEEVFASLQMGEEKMKGNLFEPSRCQFAFPVKGDNLTKFIAYLDVKERKLVYMDANLRGIVSTAESNSNILSETMPAFVEYLDSLPSVHDLFNPVRKNKNGLTVAYNDANVSIKDKARAYVFDRVNSNNEFEQMNINKLLM